MEPEQVQYRFAIIAGAWGPKIFYGIFTDSFPICGSTKKNYLIVLAIGAMIINFTAGLVDFPNPDIFVALLTVMTFTTAMMDVVVDGLMVIQARLDPVSGSEDL